MEDFLREEVSRRISLREIREISSFKADATFDITCVWGRKGEDLRTPHVRKEFLPSKLLAISEQRPSTGPDGTQSAASDRSERSVAQDWIRKAVTGPDPWPQHPPAS